MQVNQIVALIIVVFMLGLVLGVPDHKGCDETVVAYYPEAVLLQDGQTSVILMPQLVCLPSQR